MSSWQRVKIRCSECGRSYRTDMIATWNYAFGPMPDSNVKCPFCGKAFDSECDEAESLYQPYPVKEYSRSIELTEEEKKIQKGAAPIIYEKCFLCDFYQCGDFAGTMFCRNPKSKHCNQETEPDQTCEKWTLEDLDKHARREIMY